MLDIPSGSGKIYRIYDFLTTYIAGEAVAADDAKAIGWFHNHELECMDLTPDLLKYLSAYGVY